MDTPTRAKSNKRKRATTATNNKSAPMKKSKTRTTVKTLEALPWKRAVLPKMNNDPMGFHGLEDYGVDEVEGVDIVRDVDGRTTLMVLGGGDDDSNEGQSEPDGGSEWGGFSDGEGKEGGEDKGDGAELGQVTKKPTNKVKKEKEKIKETREEVLKKTKQQSKQSGDTMGSSNQRREKETGAETKETEIEAVDLSTVSAWQSMDVSPQMLSSLARLGFSTPTPIQEKAIPMVRAGHDVIGKASTGSGKTIAFALPVMEKWLQLNPQRRQLEGEGKGEEEKEEESQAKQPLAIILTPTRELAHQISHHILDLSPHPLATSHRPRICTVTGGLAVQKQQRQLEKADIIVATPGRLWDLLTTSIETLKKCKGIQFLVVDEADRLFGGGQFEEAQQVIDALDGQRDDADEDGDEDEVKSLSLRQTLVFSATLDQDLHYKLAQKGKGKGRNMSMNKAKAKSSNAKHNNHENYHENNSMIDYLIQKLNFRDPEFKFIDVNPVSHMASKLTERLIQCDAKEKAIYLYALLLLTRKSHPRTLVFSNSIDTVRADLLPLLETLKLPVLQLQSNMAQKARLRSIERFNDSPNSILLATDVAARGLDIPNVNMVVHYHVPRHADDYVHRSGRTARGMNKGLSVLLCSPDEAEPTRRLFTNIHPQKSNTIIKKSQQHHHNQSQARTFKKLDIDHKLISDLKPRVVLASEIAQTFFIKARVKKEDAEIRRMAEELGNDVDEAEMNFGGRGKNAKEKDLDRMGRTKNELSAMRARLCLLLESRVNVGGVRERDAVGRGMDLEGLRGEGGLFGRAGLDLDDE